MYWTESLGRIELQITKKQADSCNHPGQCDNDVEALKLNPSIARQLKKLDPVIVSAALKEYGAWNDLELSDHNENLTRLLWVACCDISEGNI
jgi:hypothetical protein